MRVDGELVQRPTASKNWRRPGLNRTQCGRPARRFPMTRRPRHLMRVCPSSTRAACGPDRARAAIFVACRAATGAPGDGLGLFARHAQRGTGRARGDLLRRVPAVEDGAADGAEVAEALRVECMLPFRAPSALRHRRWSENPRAALYRTVIAQAASKTPSKTSRFLVCLYR